jgi:hypothetical protein
MIYDNNFRLRQAAQRLFDTVARHLITQGRPSVEGSSCAYRSPENYSCAIGCLIPDDRYKPDLEGSDVDGLIAKGFTEFAPHRDLLGALQRVHDADIFASRNRVIWTADNKFDIGRLKAALFAVATTFNLDSHSLRSL